jgi:hypothetical protein
VSNVSSGLVKDIANQPLSELVSAPANSSTLDLGESMAMINVDNPLAHFTAQEMTAQVSWSDNPELPLPATLNDLIKYDSRYNCTSYTSATLAAMFEGKSVSFRALYLTGWPQSKLSSGVTTTVKAIDQVMKDGVPAFLNADVYPYILVYSGGNRKFNPYLQKWLRDNASPSCTTVRTACIEGGRVVIPLQDVQSMPMPKPAATGQNSPL